MAFKVKGAGFLGSFHNDMVYNKEFFFISVRCSHGHPLALYHVKEELL